MKSLLNILTDPNTRYQLLTAGGTCLRRGSAH